MAETDLEEYTPAAAWQRMKEGNLRFIAGSPDHPRQDIERRTELAHNQRPIAALFGCSDSRLAAEIIFDLGLGDLFVIRNAGQIVSTSVLGSIEFAVSELQVPLIVVLGHDECGAVAAAIKHQSQPNPPEPSINSRSIIGPILPAVKMVKEKTGEMNAGQIGKEHLRNSVKEILQKSEMVAQEVAARRLAIVGANYRLGEGLVIPDFVLGNIGEEDSNA